jgi:hypothetical protein
MSGAFTTPGTAATAGSSGGGVVIVPIYMDGKQIAEYTLDIVDQRVRQSGAGRLAR